MKINQTINKSVAGVLAQRTAEAKEQEDLNNLIEQGQTILTRLKNIALGVFGSITTELSKLLGVDSQEEGGLRATIEGLSDWIKSKLNMDELASDIEGEEGSNKFENAFKAIGERLKPIFADIGKALAEGIGAAFMEWFDTSTAGKIWNSVFSKDVAVAAGVGAAAGSVAPGVGTLTGGAVGAVVALRNGLISGVH